MATERSLAQLGLDAGSRLDKRGNRALKRNANLYSALIAGTISLMCGLGVSFAIEQAISDALLERKAVAMRNIRDLNLDGCHDMFRTV